MDTLLWIGSHVLGVRQMDVQLTLSKRLRDGVLRCYLRVPTFVNKKSVWEIIPQPGSNPQYTRK